MRQRAGKRSKARVLVVLLLISGVAIVLPTELTAGLGNLIQVLVPIQHVMSTSTPAEQGDSPPLTSEQSNRLQQRLEAYEKKFAVMSVRVADLQRHNEELSGFRSRGFVNGRLIRAQIVASDSLPWRESKLLDRGTLAGVGRGDAVLSAYRVSVGSEDGVLDGMSILAEEALVGEIKDARTHTARVLLLSDPAANPRLVRLGRPEAGEFAYLDAEFMIYGRGRNRMEIQGVSHQFIASGAIQVGDTVLTSAADERLPVPVVIGQVLAIEQDDDNAVLYNLIVEPAVDMNHLTRAYIVATTR